MCALSFTKVSLMNVAALVFGAYIFRIESSSWRILPLLRMKCPSLSFVITTGWKTILFDIRMATPDFFLIPFPWKIVFHSFNLRESIFVTEVGFLYAANCWVLFM